VATVVAAKRSAAKTIQEDAEEMASKGQNFERNFSRRLSMWWTEGEHDDWFWRSSNSGGRQTSRRQRGQTTFKQAGDIAATHPDGIPLLDAITFELKCGYTKTLNWGNIFDKPPTAKQTQWEQFWESAWQDAEANDSFGWALITKRDRREAMIWTPGHLVEVLRSEGVPRPSLRFETDSGWAYGCTLDRWLEEVSPEDIKLIAAEGFE
jgi:hypothetical protein